MSSSKPIEVEVHINDQPLIMELDTGAGVSMISERTYQSMLAQTQLQPLNVPLRTYTGERMKVLGKVSVTVRYEHNAPVDLPLVIEGEGPSLFGRNWFKRIKLKWNKLGTVMLRDDAKQELSRLLECY